MSIYDECNISVAYEMFENIPLELSEFTGYYKGVYVVISWYEAIGAFIYRFPHHKNYGYIHTIEDALKLLKDFTKSLQSNA